MAKTINNEKGFLILLLSRDEMADMLDSPGVCDQCNRMPDEGYLIAVLNHWNCPECTKEFIGRAMRYEEDIPIEEKNYEYYKYMAKRADIDISEEQDIRIALNIE